ncbi:MAG TPA: DUF4292 domain-containing protein [Sphingobacteriaceae bacterium]|nr:DUF4292 domain-containing protein [Sphingobacteriaceae bacterium]
MLNKTFYATCQTFWIISLVLLSACAPKRHLSSTVDESDWTVRTEKEKRQYVEDLMSEQWIFKNIQVRAKGFLTINDQSNHEVNVQIRMIKDEAIWMSATAILGVEVGRVLLTPDSIKVVNRLESTYFQDTYLRGSPWFGEDVDFVSLQQLLVGNAPRSVQLFPMVFSENGWGGAYFSREDREVIFDEHKRLSWWKGNQLSIHHAYGPEQFAPEHPNKSTWSLQVGALSLRATMDYNRVDSVDELSLPFNIPNGYRQIQ